MGYNFGAGNGINTGLCAGYKFDNHLILEADASYRHISGEYAYQLKADLGYSFKFNKLVSMDMSFGAGTAFFSEKTVPLFGFCWGMGVDVFRDIINVSVFYDSETLVNSSEFEGMDFIHGVTLRMKFIIPSYATKKEGRQ